MIHGNKEAPGAAYSASASEWMEGANFLCWFKKMF